MSSPGWLQIVGEDYPRGLFLHTTHTHMNIPLAVQRAPLVVAGARCSYIKTQDQAYEHLKCDGSLTDWLTFPTCVAAIIMTAAPCLLTPTWYKSLKQVEKADECADPYVLQICTNMEWHLHYPSFSAKPVEIIDAKKMFVSYFKGS